HDDIDDRIACRHRSYGDPPVTAAGSLGPDGVLLQRNASGANHIDRDTILRGAATGVDHLTVDDHMRRSQTTRGRAEAGVATRGNADERRREDAPPASP